MGIDGAVTADVWNDTCWPGFCWGVWMPVDGTVGREHTQTHVKRPGKELLYCTPMLICTLVFFY